jgi:hypothetical protein
MFFVPYSLSCLASKEESSSEATLPIGQDSISGRVMIGIMPHKVDLKLKMDPKLLKEHDIYHN